MVNLNASLYDFDDVTKIYMREIGDTKPLSIKEEKKLWKKYKNEGDESARNRLITSNLKFVAKIANSYRGRGLSYADLIAEGNMGLIKSLNYFDMSRGNRILSYSVWWIRQSITEALEKRNSYIGDLYPEDIEVKNNETKSRNSETEEYIIGKPVDSKPNEEIKQFLDKSMDILTTREREMLSMYYGLNNETPCTLEEVGKEFGLTKERVRQINEKSLKKLRSMMLQENYIR